MRVITFKAEEELIEQLHQLMDLTGMSRSEIIRLALKKLLQEFHISHDNQGEYIEEAVLVI